MTTAASRYGRLFLLTLLSCSIAWGDEGPKWIWNPVHQVGDVPPGACYFRGTFRQDKVAPTDLEVAADDTFEVYVNGKLVGQGSGWEHFTRYDISKHLVEGTNVVAIKVVNHATGSAGLAARVSSPPDQATLLVTNDQWRTYTGTFPKWQWRRFSDRNWKTAIELGRWGQTEPWIEKTLPLAGPVVSDTRPQRVPWLDAQDRTQVIQAGAKERARGSQEPLLLKPLKALGLVNKQHHHHAPLQTGAPTPADVPAESQDAAYEPEPLHTAPTRSTPKSIANPYVGDANPDPPLRTEQPPKAAPRDTPQLSLPQEKIVMDGRFSPPEGFQVESVLSHGRTGSLISATFNEFGQMLAGREGGPLLLCADADGDGTLDEVKTCCDQVTNCHGILALSGMLFVIAEGPEGVGLYRLKDENRDGYYEHVGALATFDVSQSEHGPHGLVLGPEGKIYLVVGNHAVFRGKFSKRSPRRHLYEGDLIPRHEDPGGHANGIRLPAGCVLRTDIDGHEVELFASGLRNAYDLAFNRDGQLFTFDSDMESDSGTTWYRPTQLYHVVPGSELGWRSGWAKWPSYYHDAIPPVAETGRGSPTGIVFYEHDTYPEKYRDAAFLADWSGGRILLARPTSEGAGYSVETEVFLEGHPLNVTDVEVGRDGLLYFVTGGRGTSGGLYRVTWHGPSSRHEPVDGIAKALAATQLQSSWGRQDVAAVRLQLGDQWNQDIQQAALDPSVPAEQRTQAVQLMHWMGPIPSVDLLLQLSRDNDDAVRRSAAYFLAASADQEPVAVRLLQLLGDPHAIVRRQAAESLVQANRSVPFEYLAPMLASSDRFETWAARRLLSLDLPNNWLDQALASSELPTFIQSATALLVAWPTPEHATQVVHRALELMRGYMSDDDFLNLIRVLQLAVLRGDLTASEVPALAGTVADEFPANHNLMNRELLRLLVRLQVTNIKDRYLTYLDSELSEADRIHAAIHLRFLEADWSTEEKLRLFQHLTPSATAGNSVPGYLQNVSLELGKVMSDTEFATVLESDDKQPSALLAAVMKLPESLNEEQTASLAALDRSLVAGDEMTKRLKVAVLAVLARDGKESSMAYLREVFDRDPARRPEVTIGLAEKPAGPNWEYLVRSVPHLDLEVAKEILGILQTVDQAPREPQPYDQVIALGYRLGDDGGDRAVRLLEHWQGFASTDDTPKWDQALLAWKKWLAQTYPDYQPTVSTTTASSPAAVAWDYDELLAYIGEDTLAKASTERGQQLFQEAQCAACHRHGSQGESMGPNLTGLGKRFLAQEILESIVHPSRVISDQYQAKTVVTDEGQAYTGIVGFGGEGELLILQSDGQKKRIPAGSVVETVVSPISAMPSSLIQHYSREQIADLIAFLMTEGEQVAADSPGVKR